MSNNDYTQRIGSHEGWFSFDFRSYYQYRDLFYLMVRREFVAKYKQTLLGPLWFVLQPVLTSLVFVFLFSETLKVPTSGVPPVLFYFCGLMGWNFVATSLNQISLSLLNNAEICKKVYFPRLFLPLSQLVSAYFAFLVQLSIFLMIYAVFKMAGDGSETWHLTPVLGLLPLFFLQLSLLSLGLGVWVAALTSTYRDFHYLMTFGIGLWMYASPLGYPIEMVPERYQTLLALNPLAPALVALRAAFFGTPLMGLGTTLAGIGFTLLIGLSGIVYFNKIQRSFIDTV